MDKKQELWLKDCLVGQLRAIKLGLMVQGDIRNSGFQGCKVRLMGGKMVLLSFNNHIKSQEFAVMGKERKRFDMARILLSTSYPRFIASAMPVHINGQLFVIRVSEEIVAGVWTTPSTIANSNRKKVHGDAMVAGDSRPKSSSISLVPCTLEGLIGVSPTSIASINCVKTPKSHDAKDCTSLESDDRQDLVGDNENLRCLALCHDDKGIEDIQVYGSEEKRESGPKRW
ncbi:hypothetical protein Ancab_017251 [Ancistrocladus abbreviatus]